MEGLRFLARSETRPAVLQALEEGATTRRELRERVDASRSTVSRSLDRMVEFGWVLDGNGSYRLTPLGRHAAATFAEARESFETAARLAPLLGRVPAGAFDLSPADLADAEVTTATAMEPLAPIERVTEIRADSETVRELSSVVARNSAEQVVARADAGDTDHELVLTADLVASLTDSSDYGDAFEATRDAVDVYVYDGEFPFLLTLLDDRVAFGVVSADDTPEALVESTDPEVYAWAESTYRDYREAADPL
ncbi:helix-turn-helix transcriptional regulator [Halorarius halobius]|uniref:helix-turn-helix transcriptional regulator n=1 Tax=Halorarius halobius TaxID=2962671 RepID=UPI0020CC0E30|nr:ArsR family transcriptional regulator [Halorarius halobius]